MCPRPITVGLDRLMEGILIDLPVDGHRHAFLEMTGQRGMALAQELEQVLDRRRGQVEVGNPARDLGEVADQYDASQR